jgi:hypothetical protein
MENQQLEFLGGPMDGWTTVVDEIPEERGDFITYGLDCGVSVVAVYVTPQPDAKYMHLYQTPMPTYAEMEDEDAVTQIQYVGIHQVARLDEYGACDIIWDDTP